MPSNEAKIADSALRCLSRWGAGKTTVDDIARQAGLSRATVYRCFPGGRDAIIDSAINLELTRFFETLESIADSSEELGEFLAKAMHSAWCFVSGHETIQFLLSNEPESVVTHLAFEGLEGLIAISREHLSRYLDRWLDPRTGDELAEWCTRIVVSYSVCPTEHFDVTDLRAVERFVSVFVLPGVKSRSLSELSVEVPINGNEKS